MIVTGHQVNFLPGCSVLSKVRQSDAVIWMDAMQYERHGFVNRNRLWDGDWMTVPVDEHDTFAPIRDVRIADATGRQRAKIAQTLRLHFGERAERYAVHLERPYGRLVDLNYQLLRLLMADLGVRVEEHFQSHLDTGHPVPVVSEDEQELAPARERLAAMVEEIGGTVWLSGPSGERYLHEEPFRERGIEVRYYKHKGPNPSAIEWALGRLSAVAA